MTHTPCRALPPDGRFLAQLGPIPLLPVRLEPDGRRPAPSGTTGTSEATPSMAAAPSCKR